MDGKKLRVSEYKALMKNRREEMRQLWCQDGGPGPDTAQLSPSSFLDSRHIHSLSPPLPQRSPGIGVKRICYDDHIVSVQESSSL